MGVSEGDQEEGIVGELSGKATVCTSLLSLLGLTACLDCPCSTVQGAGFSGKNLLVLLVRSAYSSPGFGVKRSPLAE